MFSSSSRMTKTTISTLPATRLSGTGRFPAKPETAVSRPFWHFPDIQAALAYTFDRNGQDVTDPGQQGWPGCPDPGSRGPDPRVTKGQIRARSGVPGPPRRPWEAPSRPSEAPGPQGPRAQGPWMLSNSYPGSARTSPVDRARPTEDTGTEVRKRTSFRFPPAGKGGPEPRAPRQRGAARCTAVTGSRLVCGVYPGY